MAAGVRLALVLNFTCTLPGCCVKKCSDMLGLHIRNGNVEAFFFLNRVDVLCAHTAADWRAGVSHMLLFSASPRCIQWFICIAGKAGYVAVWLGVASKEGHFAQTCVL